MVGFLIRMTLGLALIALGFFLGVVSSICMFYIPMVTMLQTIVSPKNASLIEEALTSDGIEYGQKEARATARLFYICYRTGYLCFKTRYIGYFLDALKDMRPYDKLLKYFETYAKEKGVVIPEEMNNGQKE